MGTILDLSIFGRETLDIKLPDPDDRILHLDKPTQQMAIALIDYRLIRPDASGKEIMRRMDTMAHMICNTNDGGISIPLDYVRDGLNTKMKMALIQAYAAWIAEIQSDPN